MIELLLAAGLSCYTVDARDEFRRFDTYGTVSEIVSVEGQVSAGEGRTYYAAMPRESIILRSVYDFRPQPVVSGHVLPKPIIGTFELGINETEDSLGDNSGEVKICLKRV